MAQGGWHQSTCPFYFIDVINVFIITSALGVESGEQPLLEWLFLVCRFHWETIVFLKKKKNEIGVSSVENKMTYKIS